MLRFLGHDLGIGADALGRVDGLHQFTLPIPLLALQREDAVPDRHAQLLVAEALDVLVGILHQHVLNVLRPRHDEKLHRPDRRAGHIAILLPDISIEIQRPAAPHIEHAPDEGGAFRAGRKIFRCNGGCHHGLRS